MELQELKNIVQDGKIFSVRFIKRTDGTERLMVARTGTVFESDPSLRRNWDPDDKNLLLVYDLQNKGLRHVPAENVIEVKAHKKTFTTRNG